MPRRSWTGKSAAAVERLLKGAFFDCQMCGQCLLSHTGLVCPMNCPKGLRNGPCGGTLDGRCETDPDLRCVWMEILERDGARSNGRPRPLHAPFDPALLGTSSVVNFLTGADRATRLPVAGLPGAQSRRRPPRTSSRLERALRLGGFAITSEVRSPRSEKAFARVEREVRILAEHVEAINATSNHGGIASMPSSRSLAMFGALGAEGVLQVCGRDVDPRSFLDELVLADEAGIQNVLCLTGDFRPDVRADLSRPEAAWVNYFRMDASQMLAEARALALGGRSLFSDLGARPAPRPFRGAVINPYSTPRSAVVARLAQKAECGAEFIQSQIVLQAGPFLEFMSLAGDAGLRERLFVLATIPVIGSPGALRVIEGLPGVPVPEAVRRRIEFAGDAALEGRRVAEELMAEIHRAGGADGFHLVNFGAAPETIAELARSFRTEHGIPRPEGAVARA